MSHYPILDWNHKFRGGLMVHGHTHGTIDDENSKSHDLRVDVGFNSSLAKKVGTFLIPIQEVINHFYEKTGGMEFYDWMNQNNKSNELD